MEELGVVLLIVFGILSLILFFKVWAMCNNVKKILQKINEETRYKYAVNTDESTFRSEMANIRELIFCDKKEEARYELKRLLYQFTLKKKEWSEEPYRYSSGYIADSNKKVEDIIALLESVGEVIENKDEILIPTDK